jgi:hypothetical protein
MIEPDNSPFGFMKRPVFLAAQSVKFTLVAFEVRIKDNFTGIMQQSGNKGARNNQEKNNKSKKKCDKNDKNCERQ